EPGAVVRHARGVRADPQRRAGLRVPLREPGRTHQGRDGRARRRPRPGRRPRRPRRAVAGRPLRPRGGDAMTAERRELGPLVPDPLWRREFPYTSAGDELVTRRDFTRYLAA